MFRNVATCDWCARDYSHCYQINFKRNEIFKHWNKLLSWKQTWSSQKIDKWCCAFRTHSEKEFSAKSVKGLKLLTVFTRELRLTIFDKVPSPPLILRNKEFRAFSWNFEIWGFISLYEILRKLMCGIAHVCFAHPESSTASEAKFFFAKIVNSSNPDTIFARKSHLRLLTGL